MSVEARHELIRRKVERADEHISNLNEVVRRFIDANPYKVVAKRDSETGKTVYYLERVTDTPPSCAAIAGDILNNLRSALDHLAQQLYLVGTGGTSGFRDQTSFLISPTAKDFKAGLSRKVEGMRQNAVDAIRALQPYHGGNGADLWTFNRLNNIDKHRLIVTVGSNLTHVNLGPGMMQQMRSAHPGRIFPEMHFWMKPHNMFPLKAGDELLITDAEPNEKTKFAFMVAIHEPGVIEGEPLIPTLVGFRDRVSNIVDEFKPLLS